jgi:hypothetical protein
MKLFTYKNIGMYSLLAIASFVIGQRLAPLGVKVAAANSSISPFVLRQQIFAPNNDGTLQITEDRVTAVAENGTEARHASRPLQPERGTSFLVIRPDGSASTSNSFLGAKVSGFLSRRRVEGRQRRPLQKLTGCRSAQEISRGDQEILGIKVAVLESQDTQYRLTSWRAIDFGCEELKLSKEQNVDGKWKTILAVLPISFEPGQPPATLLDESGLKNLPEMSPAQMRELAYQKMGVTRTSCPQCFDPEAIRKQEEAYQARQVKE